ncbi:MAG: BON domain-containing protein [Capsulimonadales bacterium]|nr:BON domain-containing protein [Capsulimonadales bacterium]
MRKTVYRIGMGAVWTAMLATFGCSPETVESAKRDIDRNTTTLRETTREIERKAKPVLEAAKPVTNAVKKEADQKVEQLKIGVRVTAALKANENLPSTIRVDAGPDAQRVTLRGTVATAEQKALAERIARETVGKGKEVRNDLKVDAGAEREDRNEAKDSVKSSKE